MCIREEGGQHGRYGLYTAMELTMKGGRKGKNSVNQDNIWPRWRVGKKENSCARYSLGRQRQQGGCRFATVMLATPADTRPQGLTFERPILTFHGLGIHCCHQLGALVAIMSSSGSVCHILNKIPTTSQSEHYALEIHQAQGHHV